MSQPPRFEPHSHQPRPSSHDAHRVGHGKKAYARSSRSHTDSHSESAHVKGSEQYPRFAPQIRDDRDGHPFSHAANTPPHTSAREAYLRHQWYKEHREEEAENSHSLTNGHADFSPSHPASAHHHFAHPIRRGLLLCVVLIVVACIAWPLYLYNDGNKRLNHIDALSGQPSTSGTTYLIVGSDAREAGAIDDGTEGQRSDSILMLHVPDSGSASLISIPRDTMADIPDYGTDKINASFSYGGAPLLVRSIEELTGFTVDHYIQISMGGVRDLTDAVGGINLCLDYDVNDELSGLQWQAGCHDSDGNTALAFSRMRYSDPLGDIGRTQRQRQVVSKIIGKAMSKSILLSPSKQKNLVETTTSVITVDNDSDLMTIGRAGLALRSILKGKGVMGTPPIASLGYWVNGQSMLLLDEEKLPAFWQKVRQGTLTEHDAQQLPQE